MECDSVRRTISDGDRRILRGRRIRSHLRTCTDCASFEHVLRVRKRDLAAIAPPLPAAAAAGLLYKILGGAGSGGTGAAASSSGGAGVGSMLGGKALAISGASKVVAAVAITAAAGAGAIEIAETTSHPASDAPAAAHSATLPHTPMHAGSTFAPGLKTPLGRSGGSLAARQHAATSHRRHGSSGNRGAARAHPLHPAHRLHPAHPITPGRNLSHPTHPAKPLHPSQPAKPTHPAPLRTGQQKGSVAPTHPTRPAKPAPTLSIPTTEVNTPVTTTPQVTEQGTGYVSHGKGVRTLSP